MASLEYFQLFVYLDMRVLEVSLLQIPVHCRRIMTRLQNL